MRGTVSLWVVFWWNEETKSKRENTRPSPRESNGLVHTRNRKLAEAADLVGFI